MHNNLGNAYSKQGNLNKAREYLEEAREMLSLIHIDGEPSDAMAKVHSSLGVVYADLQQHDLAIAEFKSAISIRDQLTYDVDALIARGENHNSVAEIYDQINVSMESVVNVYGFYHLCYFFKDLSLVCLMTGSLCIWPFWNVRSCN